MGAPLADAYGNYLPGGAISSGATNFGVAGGSSGYTIPIVSVTSGSPSANTTYFLGADGVSSVQTVFLSAAIKVPKAGTVKGAYIKARMTPGTGELVQHFVRLNDLTDAAMPSAAYNVASVDVQGTGLNLQVVAGDMLAIKIVTPATWASPATAIRWEGYIYIE